MVNLVEGLAQVHGVELDLVSSFGSFTTSSRKSKGFVRKEFAAESLLCGWNRPLPYVFLMINLSRYLHEMQIRLTGLCPGPFSYTPATIAVFHSLHTFLFPERGIVKLHLVPPMAERSPGVSHPGRQFWTHSACLTLPQRTPPLRRVLEFPGSGWFSESDDNRRGGCHVVHSVGRILEARLALWVCCVLCQLNCAESSAALLTFAVQCNVLIMSVSFDGVGASNCILVSLNAVVGTVLELVPVLMIYNIDYLLLHVLRWLMSAVSASWSPISLCKYHWVILGD